MRLEKDRCLGVVREKLRKVWRVRVIGVLVADRNRVKIGKVRERRLAQIAGVDEDPGGVGLSRPSLPRARSGAAAERNEQSGMAKVCNVHAATVGAKDEDRPHWPVESSCARRAQFSTTLSCLLFSGDDMPRLIVDVMPKPEILDPQGKAVLGALGRLDFENITSVRQGKRFELEVEGDVTDDVLERVREAATELLSNPVIEDVVSVRVEEEQA